MECNKDEALRAKEIAERKFLQKDLMAAKKFAVKAKTLFPPLDGISEFITVLDVHLMAEHRVADEKDWYAIMSLSPNTNEITVKKQYRQLALHLHPDKNRSLGAESAFKLVSEAFHVLTDRCKRQIFDQKRKTHAVNGKKVATASCSAQGMSQNAARSAPKPSHPCRAELHVQGATQRSEQLTPQPSERSTFWTRCTSCRMWFEYSLIYLNLSLCCRNCKMSFRAADAGQPRVSYKFEKMQAWKHANSDPVKKWWDGSSSSNPGSSVNASAGSGGQHHNQPCNKRMREEGCSAANVGSC